jgi:3-oxosteroid 1-dehydrogenase
VVIGSGAAGLFSAIAVQHLGLRTLVLEKAPTPGGGTAISSGPMWLGNNHSNLTPDPPEDVAAHVFFVAAGEHDEARLATARCASVGRRHPPQRAADRLLSDASGVTGVALADGEKIAAHRGIILAAGGYESNPGMVANFENLSGFQSMFPDTIAGDRLRMAREIGAEVKLIHDNHAVFLGFRNPDDRPSVCRLSGILELCARHTIVVNRAGERFADETFFQAIAPTLGLFDVKARRQPNLCCFLIFDSQYGGNASFAGRPPGAPIPAWVPHAETSAALAAELGIDPAGLSGMLDRFNTDVRGGRDRQSHRGEASWDQMRVGASLGPLDRPPFFRIERHPIALGSAGLLVDPHGLTIHVRGHAIPGLYAVGNAAAQRNMDAATRPVFPWRLE